MKALAFHGPGDVRVEQTPDPTPKSSEVLVKVIAAGLCGTDRHIADGSYSAARPVVLGHEFAGVVQQVGDDVSSLRPGMEVCIDPNLPCHACDQCHAGRINLCRNLQAIGVTRDGGLAPYVAVPASACHVLPQGLSPEHAILGEPLSCVVHGLDRAGVQIGMSSAIWGLGTAGLMMIQCLRALGQTTIIGVSHHADHRELALELGATHVLTPEEAAQGLQVDLAVEASGSPSAFEPALNAVSPGGRLLLYGVMAPEDVCGIRPEHMFRSEITIIGTYTGPSTMDRALSLLANKTVDAEAILGDRITLEEALGWVNRTGIRRKAKVHVAF